MDCQKVTLHETLSSLSEELTIVLPAEELGGRSRPLDMVLYVINSGSLALDIARTPYRTSRRTPSQKTAGARSLFNFLKSGLNETV